MKKDLDLVTICSYIFFDGHLYKDLKCFYFSSKNIGDLKRFEKLIQEKFGIKGKYYLNDGGAGRTKTHKYRVFSTKICKELNEVGVPKGSKTTTKFLVPDWIMEDPKFSREFIKIAYFCEGSMKESRKNPRIRININKSRKLLKNGIRFMNQFKKILKKNKIRTTEIGIYKAKKRKDGVVVKELRFRILTEDNNTFINKIGWLK